MNTDYRTNSKALRKQVKGKKTVGSAGRRITQMELSTNEAPWRTIVEADTQYFH